MPIITRCPNPSCGKQIGIAEQSVGKTVMCPFCNKQFVAEGESETRPLPQVKEVKAPAAKTKPRVQRHGRPRRKVSSKRRPSGAAPRDETQAPVRRAPLFDIPPSTMRILRIVSLTLVGILALSGLILLLHSFSAATLVGSTKELFNNMTAAAKREDKERLWKLTAPGDQTLALRSKEELARFLTEVAGVSKTKVINLDPKGLVLACLRSPQFGLNSWEYRTTVVKDEVGELVIEDHTGKSWSVPIIHLSAGWRLRLAQFCLTRIKAMAITGDTPEGAAEDDAKAGGVKTP